MFHEIVQIDGELQNPGVSFEDSYDDDGDDSINVIVTEHSSRDKVNASESLSKLKDINLKNINCVIISQHNQLENYFYEINLISGKKQ